MSKPAARIGDTHICPMVTPGLPPVPHVGGPVTGPGVPTVLIGGMPAAVVGDMCTCVGPPDNIILGSFKVLIGGKPAARMGDSCAHGGKISMGCPTVLIGESGASGASDSAAPGAASAPMPGAASLPKQAIRSLPPEVRPKVAQAAAFKEASRDGSPFVHVSAGCQNCSGH